MKEIAAKNGERTRPTAAGDGCADARAFPSVAIFRYILPMSMKRPFGRGLALYVCAAWVGCQSRDGISAAWHRQQTLFEQEVSGLQARAATAKATLEALPAQAKATLPVRRAEVAVRATSDSLADLQREIAATGSEITKIEARNQAEAATAFKVQQDRFEKILRSLGEQIASAESAAVGSSPH